MKKNLPLRLHCLTILILVLISSCKRDLIAPSKAPLLKNTLSFSEAKQYFEANIKQQGLPDKQLATKGKNTSSQKGIQDILYNKRPVWDKAYQQLISIGMAVKIPLDFGNIRKVVDEQSKAFVPYSSLNYLLMYKDSLQRIHTEWVTLNPTLKWLKEIGQSLKEVLLSKIGTESG